MRPRARHDGGVSRVHLARGGQLTEIVDLLLPRAELAEAKARAPSPAIEQFMAVHPAQQGPGRGRRSAADGAARCPRQGQGESHAGRARRLRRRVIRATRRLRAELAEARHAVYRRRQSRRGLGQRRGSRATPARLHRSLVAYAEQHGPKVEVRFRSVIGKSYESADKQVRTSTYFARQQLAAVALLRHASRCASARRSPRRRSLAALQQLFPTEIVHFELGEALPSPEPGERPEPLPEPSVPTLFIDHRTELSGTFTDRQTAGPLPRRRNLLRHVVRDPGRQGGARDQRCRPGAPARDVMQHKKRTVADVYEDLARRSFGMFAAALLRPPAPAPHRTSRCPTSTCRRKSQTPVAAPANGPRNPRRLSRPSRDRARPPRRRCARAGDERVGCRTRAPSWRDPRRPAYPHGLVRSTLSSRSAMRSTSRSATRYPVRPSSMLSGDAAVERRYRHGTRRRRLLDHDQARLSIAVASDDARGEQHAAPAPCVERPPRWSGCR